VLRAGFGLLVGLHATIVATATIVVTTTL